VRVRRAERVDQALVGEETLHPRGIGGAIEVLTVSSKAEAAMEHVEADGAERRR